MSGTALGNLVGLIGVFEKYASRDKDSNYLNKSELKELLENEFPMLVNVSGKHHSDCLSHEEPSR